MKIVVTKYWKLIMKALTADILVISLIKRQQGDRRETIGRQKGDNRKTLVSKTETREVVSIEI